MSPWREAAGASEGGERMPIDPKLKEILACPKCKGALDDVEEPEGFGCPSCNLLYKVEDDIPNFLIEEAVSWKAD
jgi:uncharacterized protein YbaR (Trm112 family)